MKYVGFSWRKNVKGNIKTAPVFASGKKIKEKKRNSGFKLPVAALLFCMVYYFSADASGNGAVLIPGN